MPSPSMQRAEREMAAVPPNSAPMIEQSFTDERRAVPATNLNNPSAGAVDVGRPPVADVTVDYDPNFKRMLTAVNDTTPEGKIKLVTEVNNRINNADQEHPNERFQPGAFLVGLLRGKVDDMYTAYNGGKTKTEVGRDALGNLVTVEKNQRGFNGRMYENKTNRELTRAEIAEINASRGGVITESDLNATRTANWQTAQKAYQEVANGDTSQLNAARVAAKAAANYGASENPLLGDEIYLAGKLKPVLGYISTLDPKQRQLLLGYAQRYRTASGSLQKSGEKEGSASLGDQTQLGGSVGPMGQFGPNGAIAPTANINASRGATQGTRVGERNAENINRENSINEMQTTQNAIMQQLQGVIKSPQEFQDFIKLIALNQTNNESINKVPPEFMPPGFQKIAPVDVFLGGADSVIEQRYAQQTNNGLIAAYQAALFREQRKALETGKTTPIEEVYKNFEKSDIYQGLVNYGKERVNSFTGRGAPLKKGAKIYNPNTGKLDTYGE